MVTMMVLAASVLMGAGVAAGASPFEGSDRVLVIRPDTEGDARLARQRELLLADEADLRERDMVVFAIIDDRTISPIFGKAPTMDQARGLERGKLTEAPFSITLLGKDGGVKRESAEPIPATKLFSLIDTMPMRRQEMKRMCVRLIAF